jgi:hypothetical protein
MELMAFNFQRVVSRNSSEEICLGKMNQLKFSISMNKVEMKRTQLSEKFGLYTTCDFFCMFARGRRKIPPEACYGPRRDREIRAHCREAENALAAHYNIKLID